MALKRIIKSISQVTIINSETQEETIQPLSIIQNEISNIVVNTTVIADSPLITEMKDKLDTIQSGAQVNPDMSQVATITSVSTITDEINTHKISTANPHQTTKEQVGLKLQTGDVTFTNVTTQNILFPNNYFSTAPNVLLTLENKDGAPPYKINVTKNGFTIKTATKFTGVISWSATSTV